MSHSVGVLNKFSFTHAHTYYMNAHSTDIHTRIRIYTYIHTSTYIHIHIYPHIHIHIYTDTQKLYSIAQVENKSGGIGDTRRPWRLCHQGAISETLNLFF